MAITCAPNVKCESKKHVYARTDIAKTKRKAITRNTLRTTEEARISVRRLNGEVVP